MQVILIGKDFGAAVVSLFTLLHQDRVLSFVTIGVPFMPPRPPSHHNQLPEGFYIKRWKVTSVLHFPFHSKLLQPSWRFSLQEPGRAEADFGRLDAKTVVRNVYILFSRSEIPIAPENQEIMDLVEPSTPLPYWFTDNDLATYGALYEKSGFRTALQVPYRYCIKPSLIGYLLKIGLWNDYAAFDSKFLGRWVHSWNYQILKSMFQHCW